MESSPGEVDGNTEELTGRKKSRFKFLKTRLFGRLKKKETEGQMKQSKSTSDVTAQETRRGEGDSEDDCCQYPQGTLSSRALSHDSIFLADQSQPSEPTRVLSQENVHSKIKALQLKLQQQNMRLGPPLLLIPGKRIEDSGTMSEDDGLPCSPPEMSFQEVSTHGTSYKYPEPKQHLSSLSLAGTGSEEEEQGGPSQPPSRPLSPISRLSHQAVISSPMESPSSSAGVDFSSPAHSVSCLDNSAARHRMSIKPRNQRASTKGMKLSADVCRQRSSSMNSLDQPLSETEEQQCESTETLDHKEELKSLGPHSTLHLQEQQENLTLKNVGPLCGDDEVLKSGKQQQPEVKITTNAQSIQHPDETTSLKSLSSDGEQVGKEPLNTDNQNTKEKSADANEEFHSVNSLACQSAGSATVLTPVTDFHVAEGNLGNVAQTETLEKLGDADVSRSSEPFTKPYPVPAPRTKKPSLDKLSKTKSIETEKETYLPESNCRNSVPSVDLAESLKEDNKLQRPSSFRFSISSAKYRSKTTSIENLSKDEESSANTALLRNSAHGQSLEQRAEKMENTRHSEVSKNPPFSLDKRSVLQKEVIPQNVSRTGLGSEDNEKSEKAQAPEERRGLFGVKLRTTSLSLRYRSDVAKSEDTIKRHSLDAQQMLTDSEGLMGKEPFPRDMEEVSTERKSSVQTNNAPQKDTNVDTGSDREANTGSEPTWMSLARERTRAHQSSTIKHSTQPCTPPTNSTSSSIPSTSTSQKRPTPQPRSQLQSTNKSQRLPKPGVKSNTQTERRTPNLMTTAKPEPSSTSSPSAPPPLDRAQPSWMELAKRKSLAWSDKSLD
ncbi:CRACD-like protein isoform X2 [Hoplias malabaricus]|uniref:CRACD-like protein isoform X2 n=1 Tax=Hoplias malabaricus TaxID=27720 RepID=UPI0034624115